MGCEIVGKPICVIKLAVIQKPWCGGITIPSQPGSWETRLWSLLAMVCAGKSYVPAATKNVPP